MTLFASTRQTLFLLEGHRVSVGTSLPATFQERMAFARAVCKRFAFVDARGTTTIALRLEKPSPQKIKKHFFMDIQKQSVT
ncbi:MAG: hypothetical protein OXC62_16795 [Aestuariivita sp.]|nr:hypothetical protein [Aestuariivita sp.]